MFRPRIGGVDEALGEIELPPFLQVLGEGSEHRFERSIGPPVLEAAMTGLGRGVAIGQIGPRGTRAEDPEDPVQDIARIAPRAAASITAHPRLRQQRFQDGPLGIGEIHGSALGLMMVQRTACRMPVGFMR